MREPAKRAVRIAAVMALAAGAAWFVRLQYPGSMYAHPLRAIRIVTSDPPRELAIPVADVSRRALRDSWHAPRTGGRVHQGIDIFAPRGRPVVSATDGIVVTVGENRLGGRIVRILGPGGYWHYYAHLDAFAGVREGEIVRRGTVIGYVGDSGNARGTPPHLHYGIYRFRGGAVNPYPWLAGQR